MSTQEPNEPTVTSQPEEVEASVETPSQADKAAGEAQAGAAAGEAQAGAAAGEAEAKAQRSDKPEPPPPDYREIRIQTLERALAERESTLHSYIRAHKKAEADFEAYRQRLERDRERELALAKVKMVERLLEVDDNLERTISAAKTGHGAIDALVAGAEMVHRQFVERLSELGLERVDPTGKPFDPTSMEALGMVPVDDPAKNDTVVMTLRSGYRLGDREIRPALVQVGRFFS